MQTLSVATNTRDNTSCTSCQIFLKLDMGTLLEVIPPMDSLIWYRQQTVVPIWRWT
jgi:hypothetical protein